MAYLSNQKAVVTRQRHRHIRRIDITKLSIGHAAEMPPHETRNLQRVYILKPHETFCSPLEVLKFW